MTTTNDAPSLPGAAETPDSELATEVEQELVKVTRAPDKSVERRKGDDGIDYEHEHDLRGRMDINQGGGAGKFLFILIVLFVIVVLRCAWMCDDAYITFRTLDNFVHGHGLRWNIAERVQSFTHPLWLFAMTGAWFISREVYYSGLALSLLLSLATVLLVARRVALTPLHAMFGVAVLTLSKAFIDYSTSGMENPLTHLLLAAFWAIYFARRQGPAPLFTLALIAGLATFNRMDTVLFYLPPLAWLFLRRPSLKALLAVALGFSPFIAWEIFSVIYYGFPFPNTAYAKLGLGEAVARRTMAQQGYYYLINSFDTDPITLSAIGGGVLLTFYERRWRDLPLVCGLGLYLLYVLRIGGDFMAGRMLTALLLGGVLLLVRSRSIQAGAWSIPALAAVFMVGLMSPVSPLLSRSDYGKTKKDFVSDKLIADERGYYYQATGLLKASQTLELPARDDVWIGRKWREQGAQVRDAHGIGFLGYYAGPQVFIIDHFALCDPLLARLRPVNPSAAGWRPGHSERAFPDGYEATLKSGKNVIEDLSIAQYYDRLCLVTRDPLWSARRWAEIWRMNIGANQCLLAHYKPPAPKPVPTPAPPAAP